MNPRCVLRRLRRLMRTNISRPRHGLASRNQPITDTAPRSRRNKKADIRYSRSSLRAMSKNPRPHFAEPRICNKMHMPQCLHISLCLSNRCGGFFDLHSHASVWSVREFQIANIVVGHSPTVLTWFPCGSILVRRHSRMELSEVESKLKFTFPVRHRQAILDSNDPIRRACDFLILSDNRHSDLLLRNEWMHSSEFGNPWPDFLIVFASNGCGDYFAYDTRQTPASIIYIDPDDTVEKNLQSSGKLCYGTFEEWYKSAIEPYTCRRCKSHEARFEELEGGECLLRVCPRCGFRERAIAIDP
jgi:hypothetical protein